MKPKSKRRQARGAIHGGRRVTQKGDSPERFAAGVSCGGEKLPRGSVKRGEISSNLQNKNKNKLDARQHAEERFHTVVESAPDAMVLTDEDGKIALVNQQTEKLFGYSRRELIGQPVEILLPERFRKRHASHRVNYMKDPQARPMGADLDVRGLRKDGSEFPAEVSLSPMALKDGRSRLTSRIIRDVSQQRAMAEQIRQAALFEERNRLARDVHDLLAQGLTAIVLQLEAAEEQFKKKSPESLLHIARARELARSTLNEVRQYALSATAPDGKNLSESIRKLLERFRSETPIRLEFAPSGTVRPVPGAVAENLVRVAQQAVTNALQHSQARRIQVKLRFHKSNLQLCVTDDGQGFVPSAVPGGFGLRSMRERVSELGGKFKLTSKPGKGTRIDAEVPGQPDLKHAR